MADYGTRRRLVQEVNDAILCAGRIPYSDGFESLMRLVKTVGISGLMPASRQKGVTLRRSPRTTHLHSSRTTHTKNSICFVRSPGRDAWHRRREVSDSGAF